MKYVFILALAFSSAKLVAQTPADKYSNTLLSIDMTETRELEGLDSRFYRKIEQSSTGAAKAIGNCNVPYGFACVAHNRTCICDLCEKNYENAVAAIKKSSEAKRAACEENYKKEIQKENDKKKKVEEDNLKNKKVKKNGADGIQNGKPFYGFVYFYIHGHTNTLFISNVIDMSLHHQCDKTSIPKSLAPGGVDDWEPQMLNNWTNINNRIHFCSQLYFINSPSFKNLKRNAAHPEDMDEYFYGYFLHAEFQKEVTGAGDWRLDPTVQNYYYNKKEVEEIIDLWIKNTNDKGEKVVRVNLE